MQGCAFRRGMRTLREAAHRKRRRRKNALDLLEQPFDYFGRTQPQVPIDIDDDEFVEYLYQAFIDAKTEAARFPKPESHHFYILDTAAYHKLQSVSDPEFDPLSNWAFPRLQQHRLYTTAEDASEEDGWLKWGAEDRPSYRDVQTGLFPYIGYAKVPLNLTIALTDLMQAYTRDPVKEYERQAIFVTGYENLTREFFRRPVMWMKFRQFMRETYVERVGGFEMRDVRQVYDCEASGVPEELPFDDLFPKELWKEVEAYSPRMGFSVDRLPISLPDWYDEFPVDPNFWEALPDAESRPWDRKHEWFKLRRPDPGRLVYFCDLAAYRILNEELEKNADTPLERWTRRCLSEGKLYVRDWERPSVRGLPRRNEQLERRDRRDRRGWKLLPWPVSNLEYADECPALANTAWPILDYCFIVDRCLKENVFVTGDPKIAAEIGRPELRNWLLRSRRMHLVHDVRQVYSCGSQSEPVAVNLD